MKTMRIEQIAATLGCSLFTGSGEITAVVTDSRKLVPGCLFVALVGDSFDGHTFVCRALSEGAAFAVVQKPGNYPGDRVLTVGDTRAALLDIAGLYRSLLDVRVVGVTGSVGKTTTKEMTACALSAKYLTLKNEANLNNEVGLSWTIFQLTEAHRAAVLEMGMDGPGQIRPLSMAARPDVAVVTNIGVSHMEALGSREGILAEKLSIGDGLPDGAPLLLCGDNDLLRDVISGRLNVLLYGIENKECDVRAANIKEFSTHTTFEILYNGMRLDATIPTMGRHNVYNALAGFLAAVCLEVPPRDAIAALRNYRPAGMRQNIVKHSAFTVVEDCYNASPDSMHAALTTLGSLQCDGRRIAVLADMLELGQVEREAHYEVGRLAASCGIDLLLCTGKLAEEYLRGARDAGMEQAFHIDDQDSLFERLRVTLAPGDTVWIKGSRAMKLERIIKRIYEEL